MRRNPFDEIEELFDRLGRQFDGGVADGPGFPTTRSVAVDVEDAGDEYVVTADLPGYDTDDVELTLREETLRIEATSQEAEEFETGRYIRRERTDRSVSRTVRLPEPVDDEAVSASYNNGVLTVTLPKRTGDEDSRRIDIE